MLGIRLTVSKTWCPYYVTMGILALLVPIEFSTLDEMTMFICLGSLEAQSRITIIVYLYIDRALATVLIWKPALEGIACLVAVVSLAQKGPPLIE